MSKWLQNVGNFLEKLDDQVAETQTQHDDEVFGEGAEAIESILAARGLHDDGEEEDVEEEGGVSKESIEQEDTAIPNDVTVVTEKVVSVAPENSAAPEEVETEGREEVQSALDVQQSVEAVSEPSDPSGGPTDSTPKAEPANPLPSVEPKPAVTEEPQSDQKQLAAAAPRTPINDKEVRSLRRNILVLNQRLEHAESEMDAQRQELERAAERLEKDRLRFKQERQTAEERFQTELTAMQAQHEASLLEFQRRADEKVETIKSQLRQVEERRTQEGGDWSKEMSDAVLRENELAEQVALLQDEKTTMMSQISTLQSQQDALGNRLESLTQTADMAMEREREAEDRLDQALSLHARQISLRQSRESELERTIADLGAALAAARSDASRTQPQASGEAPRLRELEEDLDASKALVADYKERLDTLKREVQHLAASRDEESTMHRKRLDERDRRIAELSEEIKRKQAKEEDRRKPDMMPRNGDVQNQLTAMSDELVSLRETIAQRNTDVTALRSRLKAATHRAEQAEARSVLSSSIEVDMGAAPDRLVRRGLKKKTKFKTMSSALELSGVSTDSTGKMSKALDEIDSVLASGGKFLRHNPVARLLFLMYLLLLHLWTCLLVLFHAHSLDAGDASAVVPHGPAALMHQSAVPPSATTTGT